MKQNHLLDVERMTKQYTVGNQQLTALKQISVTIDKGEFVGLIGPSGSGKTTLLNIVGCLDAPSAGSITLLGNNLEKISHNQAAQLRNHHIGFVFQTYNLLPVYTVFENIELPLLLLKIPKKERIKRIEKVMEWVGITDKATVKPNQLSGGQAQRVAIARAIVKQPEIVLADEPTANLDAENSYNILNLMLELNRELNTTFLLSTHDEKVIKYLRRKIVLFDGNIQNDESVD